jgi:hypothetical protein
MSSLRFEKGSLFLMGKDTSHQSAVTENKNTLRPGQCPGLSCGIKLREQSTQDAEEGTAST